MMNDMNSIGYRRERKRNTLTEREREIFFGRERNPMIEALRGGLWYNPRKQHLLSVNSDR